MNSKDFEEGMAAKLIDGKLQWKHKDAWIQVDDLPTRIIDELKQQSFSMACIIVEDYLNDNSDGFINDCGA